MEVRHAHARQPAFRLPGVAKGWASRDLQDGGLDNHTSHWTTHLRINKEARFPRVDDLVPRIDDAASTLHVSETDAEFLTEVAPRLPGEKELSAPVTVDLDSQCVLFIAGGVALTTQCWSVFWLVVAMLLATAILAGDIRPRNRQMKQ